MSLTLQQVTISYAASPSVLLSCLAFTFQYVKLLHLVLSCVPLPSATLPYATLHSTTLHHTMLPHPRSHFSSFNLPSVSLRYITLRYLNSCFIMLQHLPYPYHFFSPIALPCLASRYIKLYTLLLTWPLQTSSSQSFSFPCVLLCYFTQHLLSFIQHRVHYATILYIIFYAMLPCSPLHCLTQSYATYIKLINLLYIPLLYPTLL